MASTTSRTKKLKDKKISIYEGEEIQKPGGMPVLKWSIKADNIWAYVRQLSADEFFAAAQSELYKEEMLFEINWRDDIDNYMKVLYKDKWYDITRIDPYEGYKNDIKIYVKSTPIGGIPKLT